jgi:hypothetical protein
MRRIHTLLVAGLLAGAMTAVPAFAQSAPSGNPQTAPQSSGATGKGAFIEQFRAANTTHDGKLTPQQAEAGNMPFVAKHFSEIDTTNKGYVTLREIGAYIQKLKAKRND